VRVITLLIGYHHSLNYHRKKLIDNPKYKAGKFYRFYNELPTLLMIGIVIFCGKTVLNILFYT